MKHQRLFAAAVLIILAVTPGVAALGQAAAQSAMVSSSVSAQPAPSVVPNAPSTTPPSPATQAQQQQQPQQQPQPQAAQQFPSAEAPVPLRVMTNKSILINTAERLKRVSITDP